MDARTARRRRPGLGRAERRPGSRRRWPWRAAGRVPFPRVCRDRRTPGCRGRRLLVGTRASSRYRRRSVRPGTDRLGATVARVAPMVQMSGAGCCCRMAQASRLAASPWERARSGPETGGRARAHDRVSSAGESAGLGRRDGGGDEHEFEHAHPAQRAGRPRLQGSRASARRLAPTPCSVRRSERRTLGPHGRIANEAASGSDSWGD
jgi:hypothetical protein